MRNLGITIAAVIGLLLGWYEPSHAQFAADAKPAPNEVVVRSALWTHAPPAPRTDPGAGLSDWLQFAPGFGEAAAASFSLRRAPARIAGRA